jgi:hypothetical protein
MRRAPFKARAYEVDMNRTEPPGCHARLGHDRRSKLEYDRDLAWIQDGVNALRIRAEETPLKQSLLTSLKPRRQPLRRCASPVERTG